MKKMMTLLTMTGLVLLFGTASADIGGADSLIYSLDPSKVPGFVELETGAVTLAEPAKFTARGSAAGGMSIEKDTFLNYIDPSRLAGYVDRETGVVGTGEAPFAVKGSAAGGMSMGHDTFLNYIDPSRLPGHVDPETGVIN